jgi:hypothetical protein
MAAGFSARLWYGKSMMTRIRNGLTTLISLLVVLVVLMAAVSLSAFLQYGETKELRAQTEGLREDIGKLLGGGAAGLGAGASAVEDMAAAAEAATLETLTVAVGEKDREIEQLRSDLQFSIDRARQLDAQVRSLRGGAGTGGAAQPVTGLGEEAAATAPDSGASGEALGSGLALRPALGTVRVSRPNYGFVIIDAGSDRDLQEGDVLALRRQGKLVGRVRLTEVRGQDSTAELVRNSLQEGMEPAVNDEVVLAAEPEKEE